MTKIRVQTEENESSSKNIMYLLYLYLLVIKVINISLFWVRYFIYRGWFLVLFFSNCKYGFDGDL